MLFGPVLTTSKSERKRIAQFASYNFEGYTVILQIYLTEDVSDWSAGDEIIIATTGSRHSQIESEKRTIASISAGKLKNETASIVFTYFTWNGF